MHDRETDAWIAPDTAATGDWGADEVSELSWRYFDLRVLEAGYSTDFPAPGAPVTVSTLSVY